MIYNKIIENLSYFPTEYLKDLRILESSIGYDVYTEKTGAFSVPKKDIPVSFIDFLIAEEKNKKGKVDIDKVVSRALTFKIDVKILKEVKEEIKKRDNGL